jgi:hypothetical protein
MIKKIHCKHTHTQNPKHTPLDKILPDDLESAIISCFINDCEPPVMYLCVRGIDLTSFYDFDIRFWDCSRHVYWCPTYLNLSLNSVIEND